jgi:uncharacterized OsmC-like protein
MRYEITARVVAAGVSAATAKGATVEFDTSASQQPGFMGPAELLATAFAACVLKNVERFSTILPFPYCGAAIRVTTEREDRPPRIARIHYVLTVQTAEPPARVELLHRNIVKFGTVFNTLAAACQVTGEIAAVPGETAEPLTTGRAPAASPNSPA